MAGALTFTKNGVQAAAATTLPKAVFGVVADSHRLLHQAYRSEQANARSAHPRTKTRTAVRGGGRKPWQQKGTGRARAGSIRSPIWRGGGITFGPTGAQNHTIKLTTVARRQAIRQALSLKATAGRVVIIEELAAKDGRVKPLLELLHKLPTERRIGLVTEPVSAELRRATNNVGNLRLFSARRLSTSAVLDADWLVITKPALEAIESWLAARGSKEPSGSKRGSTA